MKKKWVRLDQLADVSLGYKSLQNDFFYLSPETVQTYRIEKRFLRSLFLLRDLTSDEFVQAPSARFQLFYCDVSEQDLVGTGALRYIRSMSDRTAKRKKQSHNPGTIKETLAAQSGARWYGPKAATTATRIWLRKAFDGVFAPFVFRNDCLVDQRCNRIAPFAGIGWTELAAVLSSTIFALALEGRGAASMGGGALEVATTQLRAVPVLNIRELKEGQRKRLTALAEKLWAREVPIDWSKEPEVGKHLRALDEWLLGAVGSKVPVDRIYEDLRESVRVRVRVAKERTIAGETKQAGDISAVARSIADTVRRQLESNRFPENFYEREPDEAIVLPSGQQLNVELGWLLNRCHLIITDSAGKKILENNISRSHAEIVACALMVGRRDFRIPSSEKTAARVAERFSDWISEIRTGIDNEIESSSIGTGFEHPLRAAVYKELKLNVGIATRSLPDHLTIEP